MASSVRPKILVGLDFGTTFSGISYTIGGSDTRVIETTTVLWNDGTTQSPKCPTSIQLPKRSSGGNPSSDESADGLAQDSSLHLCEWFKLSLTDKIDLPEPIRQSDKLRETTKIREDLGYTAYDVTLKFMEDLWAQFLQYANEDPVIDDLRLFDLDLTVAVPLFWGKSCENQLRNIVGQLQNSTPSPTSISVSFIAEPEAAAKELLRDERRTLKLQGGDAVIICDCGGGTIDSVAYKIAAGSKDTIEELLLNTSEFGGAVTQDEKFSAILKEKIAGVMQASDFAALTTTDFLPLINEHWHIDLRVRFMGNNTPITIPLPNDWFSLGSDTRTITFHSDDIDEVFQPVMIAVRVIQDQIAELSQKFGCYPKGVIIAGGFGRNRYLRQEVKDAVSNICPDIRVVDYENAKGWASVSRGAAQAKATLSTVRLEFDAHYCVIPAGSGSVRLLGEKGSEHGTTWIRSQDLKVSENERTRIQQFELMIHRKARSGIRPRPLMKVVWPFRGNRTPDPFMVTMKIQHEGSVLALYFLVHDRTRSVRIPLTNNKPTANLEPLVLHEV